VELLSNMMTFVDMADAKNTLALTCWTLCKSVWDQKEFWLAFGGPYFLQESSQELKMMHSVTATRSAFRRWVFDIMPCWSHHFATRANELSSAAAIQDAYFLLSGLSREDASAADLSRFIDATIQAINRSTDDEDDSLATAFVVRSRSRADLLGSKLLRDLEHALDDAAERAILRHIQTAEDDAEDKDDFDELAEQDEPVKIKTSECSEDGLLKARDGVISDADATWLSQRFLMVMSEHHGWD